MKEIGGNVVLIEQYQILNKYFPSSAVEMIWQYLVNNDIVLSFRPKRCTKLGDYRNKKSGNVAHAISINIGLTKEFALFVMLHEMAHHKTFVEYGTAVKPHGIEWQKNFIFFLKLYYNHFPKEIWTTLDIVIQKVPLQRKLLLQVEHCLRYYNCQDINSLVTLNQIDINCRFCIEQYSKYVFVKKKRLRTYWLCVEETTNRTYKVRGDVVVSVVE